MLLYEQKRIDRKEKWSKKRKRISGYGTRERRGTRRTSESMDMVYN